MLDLTHIDGPIGSRALHSPQDDRSRLDGLVLRAFREATGRKYVESTPRIVGERMIPAPSTEAKAKEKEKEKEKGKGKEKGKEKEPPTRDAWGGLVPP